MPSTKENQFLLELIRAFLYKGPLSPPQGLNWNLVLRELSWHHLGPIARFLIRDKLPDSLKESLDRLTLQSLKATALQVTYRESIKKTFHKAGIPYFVVKGRGLDTFVYKDPFFRPSNDIDIFVPKERLAEVYRLFESLGLCPYRERSNNLWLDQTYSREVCWKNISTVNPFGRLSFNGGPCDIDLHWDPHYFTDKGLSIRFDSKLWSRYPFNESETLKLHTLFVIAHAETELAPRFIQWIDLALLKRKNADLFEFCFEFPYLIAKKQDRLFLKQRLNLPTLLLASPIKWPKPQQTFLEKYFLASSYAQGPSSLKANVLTPFLRRVTRLNPVQSLKYMLGIFVHVNHDGTLGSWSEQRKVWQTRIRQVIMFTQTASLTKKRF